MTRRLTSSTALYVSVTVLVTSTGLPLNGSASSQLITFDQPRLVIGRGAHADIRLPSRAVSDPHAVIRVEAGELSILDERSTNGTMVNGQPLVQGRKKSLRSGDKIVVPGFEISVESTISAPDPPERTASVARKLLTEALAAAGGEAAPPELILASGRRPGQRWKFPPAPSRLLAGRGDGHDVLLDDVDCSRQHAEFVRTADGVIVRDLESKNGIFLGERRIQERRLRDGDQIRLGRSLLQFIDPVETLLRAFESGTDEPVPITPPVPVAPAEPEPAPNTLGPPVVQNTPAGDTSAVDPPKASELSHGRRKGRLGDWILVALAFVVLGISTVALYFLLRGTPIPPR